MSVLYNPSRHLMLSQPIYDRHKKAFGFELVPVDSRLQSGAAHEGEFSLNDEMIMDLAAGITGQLAIYSKPLFISLPDSLLRDDSFLASLSKQIVIQVHPNINKSDLLTGSIKKWRDYGYQFLLDGFDFSPQHKEILHLFSYAKIDATNYSAEDFSLGVKFLPESNCQWIIKNLATEELYSAFCDHQATLFQGYYLARPVPVEGVALRNKINGSVGLGRMISEPDDEVEGLVRTVSSDPNLVVQLLKIINSPLCALRRPIESIKDAVLYLGMGQVRKWIMIMALLNTRSVCRGTIRLILTRAKACEFYASKDLQAAPEQAFLTGILSGVDLLYGIRPEEFFEQVSLDQSICTAVLTSQGALGRVLDDCLKIEGLVMQSRVAEAKDCPEAVVKAYSEAGEWAENVLSLMVE